jgi:hypothetical protein
MTKKTIYFLCIGNSYNQQIRILIVCIFNEHEVWKLILVPPPMI